ncbi:unnamed protein product [Linum trigynum]|uniref:Uncharacterized protein n=1 Tax=Linum trigynum TaxID=586398 RepID=A0AAV2F505_9ROSI
MGTVVIYHQRIHLIIIIMGAFHDNFCMLLNILMIAFFFLLLYLYGNIKVVFRKLCTSFLNDLYVLLYAPKGILYFTGKGEVSLGHGLDMRIHLGKGSLRYSSNLLHEKPQVIVWIWLRSVAWLCRMAREGCD